MSCFKFTNSYKNPSPPPLYHTTEVWLSLNTGVGCVYSQLLGWSTWTYPIRCSMYIQKVRNLVQISSRWLLLRVWFMVFPCVSRQMSGYYF